MAHPLEIVGLKKSFGGLPAIDGATLALAEGERRLLLGPNGAGKTTLFNLITGELEPDAGSVRVSGREVAGGRPERCAHLGVGRTYQIITLFPRDTLAQNVVLALLGVSPRRWDPVTSLRAHAGLWQRARDVLAQVGQELKTTSPPCTDSVPFVKP